MIIQEAIALIQPAVITTDSPTQWADLGCGSGLFTKALASLLSRSSIIHAIDKTHQEINFTSGASIQFMTADFEIEKLNLPPLDGIMMANSLHYIKEKKAFMKRIIKHLKKDGQVIFVEYERDFPNTWVPYPILFSQLKELLSENGFHKIQKIGERESSFGPVKMYACTAQLFL